MPDLNELLRWSIANSTLPQNQTQNDGQSPQTQSQSGQQISSSEGGLTIRYNPPGATSGTNGTAVLHSTDHAPADLSPASTPGPGTPTGEIEQKTFPLPNSNPTKRDDLTTEMLDLIMGKSDSIIMKEKMAFAIDEKNPVEERVEALDDFEMLIELIDNANNMPILKLWQPLLGLLSSDEPEIVSNALWIIGTAVQNNIKAQAALHINNAFPQILRTFLSSSSTVRSKSIYALSASIKHWPIANQALSKSYPLNNEDITGYSILLKALKDSNSNVIKKTTFLISTLVLQSNEIYKVDELSNEVENVLNELKKQNPPQQNEVGLIQGLSKSGIFKELFNILKSGSNESIEVQENSFKSLSNALKFKALSDDEKVQFGEIWDGLSKEQKEERGFSEGEVNEINQLLA